MTEDEQRQAVVKEALDWVGTKYHHMGTIKKSIKPDGTVDKGGVDCATLLNEVYSRTGMIDREAVEYYPIDWHKHNHAERYLNRVMTYSVEISEEKVKPGDVVLYKFGLAYAHGAIVINPGWPSIVHAPWTSRMVHADTGNMGVLEEAPRRFFTLWGNKS